MFNELTSATPTMRLIRRIADGVTAPMSAPELAQLMVFLDLAADRKFCDEFNDALRRECVDMMRETLDWAFAADLLNAHVRIPDNLKRLISMVYCLAGYFRYAGEPQFRYPCESHLERTLYGTPSEGIVQSTTPDTNPR